MQTITLIDPIALEVWLIYVIQRHFHQCKIKNLQKIFYTSGIYAKNQVHSSILTWNTVDSRIMKSDWPRAVLTMLNLKFTNHLLHFLNLYLYAKNQFDLSILSTNFQIISYFFSIYISMQTITLIDPIALEVWLIYESCTLIGQRHFHQCKIKNLQKIFYTSGIYAKNQVHSSILTWNTVDSRIMKSDWPRAFLTMLNLKFTNHLLHLYLYAKNQFDLSIFSTHFQIISYFFSIYISMQTITLIDPIALEVWLIYESCNLIGQRHFHQCKIKNLQKIFYTSGIYAKNQVHSSILTWNTVDSRIMKSDWPRAFLTMLNLKFTNHYLHFLNLYLHAKNQFDLSIFSPNFQIISYFFSIYISIQKITLIDPIALEIWLLYESCNFTNAKFKI